MPRVIKKLDTKGYRVVRSKQKLIGITTRPEENELLASGISETE